MALMEHQLLEYKWAAQICDELQPVMEDKKK